MAFEDPPAGVLQYPEKTGEHSVPFGGKEAPEAGEVQSLFCALPTGERAAIVLHYYEGMSVRDIAKLMDVREGTVKSWLSRGRNHLKDILEKKENAQ